MRKEIRKKGISARDALSIEERIELSEQLVQRIISSPEFARANTIMIYKAFRGEVRLESLEKAAEEMGKRLVYPLCQADYKMLALHPKGDDAWVRGAYGITEPVLEKSDTVAPDNIDMVICPCTAFDMEKNRIGMGAGYYDRFLPGCINATIAAVGFDVQKVARVPMEEWDRPMDLIFTEKEVIR